MNGDWDRMGDRINYEPGHAAAHADEARRRAGHPAYKDPLLLVMGGLMVAAVVIGLLYRAVL